MKNKIAFFICVTMLAFSCADDPQPAKKDSNVRKDQLGMFVSQLLKRGLSTEVLASEVGQFLVSQGATPVAEGSPEALANQVTHNAREAECSLNANFYSWGGGEYTWVYTYSGCSICGGSPAIKIYEVSYVNGVRTQTEQVFCSVLAPQ